MAIRTREEYLDGLRGQHPKVYMLGERIENVVDHPLLKMGANINSVSCDLACAPDYRELATVRSPFIDEEISRWIHIPENAEDAIAILRLMRDAGSRCGIACIYRECTYQILAASLVTSYEIDKKYGTNYHDRMRAFVKYVHKNDLAIGGAVTDGKGDRLLRPIEQPDPDMYLRVVDKRKDGIVVRGAKIHSTSAVYMNYLFVAPIRLMEADEKDYAVSFFTPIDAEGITIICRPPEAPPEYKDPADNPLSSKFGTMEGLVVFEDVFVPWDYVCMCGEYEFIGQLGLTLMAHHIMGKGGCAAASEDLKIGATALAAECSGVGEVPHVLDNLTEMMITAEIMYACGIAAAVGGRKHESGVYIPATLPQLAAKIYYTKRECLDVELMLSSVGGLAGTMVGEKDYKSAETRKLVEKYYKGKAGVPTEDRIRAYRLVADLIGSEAAGWHHCLAICGGAIAHEIKQWIRSGYDLEAIKGKARRLAGIE